MIQIINANNRHFTDMGWLKTYWLFSFSNYYDPENLQHGALRVFNDDVVQPGAGFPTHPHEEMEIVSIVLDGELTHKDSMGNTAVIRPGDIQRMSAGTGITHSEFNSAAKAVHFYQIWIYPNVKGLKPSYDQKHFHPSAWRNRLLPVASGQGLPDTVTFHTDATIYMSQLDSGKTTGFETTKDRNIFIYLTAGCLEINAKLLNENDQARIVSESNLDIAAREDAGFILIDVPSRN